MRWSVYVGIFPPSMQTEYVYEWQGVAIADSTVQPPPEPPTPPRPPISTIQAPGTPTGAPDGVIAGDPPAEERGDPIPSPPTAESGQAAQPGRPTSLPPRGMVIRTDERTAMSGETIMIPVYLQRGQGVANMNFTVAYDARVARAEGRILKGNLVDANTQFEANPAEVGIVRVGFARGNDLRSFDGTLANIPFRVTGKPGDRTPLTVSVLAVNGADGSRPAIATLHGEIVVVDERGGVPGSTTGKSELTPADALNALKMSVRLIPEDLRADINQDGRVMSDDARLILQRVVGR